MRAQKAHLLFSTGMNVAMVSYRGYGLSDNATPTEKGLKLDADAALSAVLGQKDLVSGVILMGSSLGGAVAIDLAARNQGKVKALVLENTFTSIIPDMVDELMPALSWLKPVGTNRWNSRAVIGSITEVPMLFLSGQRDEIVPPRMMKELYEAAEANKNKEIVHLPSGDHNGSWLLNSYGHHLTRFLQKLPK